jgi:hypothetical protein
VQVEDKDGLKHQYEHDDVYLINGDQLLRDIIEEATSITEDDYEEERKKYLKDFVRQFNKMHFVCNTTKNIEFKDELKHLCTLKEQLNCHFDKLQSIYQVI